MRLVASTVLNFSALGVGGAETFVLSNQALISPAFIRLWRLLGYIRRALQLVCSLVFGKPFVAFFVDIGSSFNGTSNIEPRQFPTPTQPNHALTCDS